MNNVKFGGIDISALLYTIVRKRKKQPEHIIFDLRRLNKIDEQKYLIGLKRWSKMPRVKTLLVITKDGNLLDIKGRF